MAEKDISRRIFIKRLGTGVAGSGLALSQLSAAVSAGKDDDAGEKAPKDQVLLQLTVNGKAVRLHIPASLTLAELLRDRLNLSGTKVVCNHGECGACTVLLDGKAVYSCHILALDAAGKEVLTVEGLLKGEELHPLQEAFVKEDGLQCGFCTPGQIMSAYALLKQKPHPTPDDIREGMAGNLCRCGAYPKIAQSVLAAAKSNARAER
ncbi:MAG TPA: (2Fe-2S)-binding protein [Caldithrix abyssi]|uniref:(2Fe-2S)-binding protein n=1 Tax=Caldithrix abyssi TaxID=187145 RepID=A0A7V4WUD7_CALAY|nr:(2Fe-2S)-binding protein [Caldithrix abyssi]